MLHFLKIYIGNDFAFPEGWTVDNLMTKYHSRLYNSLVLSKLC